MPGTAMPSTSGVPHPRRLLRRAPGSYLAEPPILRAGFFTADPERPWSRILARTGPDFRQMARLSDPSMN